MFINFILRLAVSKIFIWVLIFALTAYYLYNVIFFMTHTSWQQHESVGDSLKYYNVDENNIVLLPEEESTENEGGGENDRQNCDIENRVTCNLSEALSCAKICNSPTTCVRFTDTDVPIIMRDGRIIKFTPDKNLNIGLCIDINHSIEAQKCTARYGAKRELHEIADRQYGYVCECTAPTVFIKNHISDDCSNFIGCKNRSSNVALDNWRKPEEIKCTRQWNEIFHPYDGHRGPLCERGNYYQLPSTTTLHDELYLPWDDISPEYTKYFGGDKKARELHPKGLPNPCRFDAITNEPVEEHLWGDVYSTRINNIVVCVSKIRNYRTISFDGDYLQNNGGIRANGVVKISDKKITAGNKDPRSWVVYETGTADPRTGNLAPPLVGLVYHKSDISQKLFAYLNAPLFSANVYPFATANDIQYMIVFNYPEENVIFQSINNSDKVSFQVFRNLFYKLSLLRGYGWQLAYQTIRTSEMQYNFYEDAIANVRKPPNSKYEFPSGIQYNSYELKSPMVEYEPILVIDKSGKRAINTKCPFYTGQVIITSKDNLAPLYHEHTGLISSYVEYANDRYPTVPMEARIPKTLRKAKPLDNKKFWLWFMPKGGKYQFNAEGPYYLNESTQSDRQTCIPYESFLPDDIREHMKCSST
ncbi:Pif-1 protein 1 [Dolichomitus sp. PSUC_FEM 10030005]|nr:Pif-1 protein 1 [Dolichomitus sp. PSUC_FEM 10030005]